MADHIREANGLAGVTQGNSFFFGVGNGVIEV